MRYEESDALRTVDGENQVVAFVGDSVTHLSVPEMTRDGKEQVEGEHKSRRTRCGKFASCLPENTAHRNYVDTCSPRYT